MEQASHYQKHFKAASSIEENSEQPMAQHGSIWSTWREDLCSTCFAYLMHHKSDDSPLKKINAGMQLLSNC